MKRKLGMLAALAVALLLTACSSAVYGYEGPHYNEMTLIHHCLPVGHDYSGDVEILETDAYGRILFSYSIETDLCPDGEDGRLWALAITQPAEAGKTAYYEDLCYRIASDPADFTEEVKTILKAVNGWSADPDTLSHASLITVDTITEEENTVPLSYSMPALEELALAFCGEDELYAAVPVAVDKEGRLLMVFRVFNPYLSKGQLIETAAYAAILPAEGYGWEGAETFTALEDILRGEDEVAVTLPDEPATNPEGENTLYPAESVVKLSDFYNLNEALADLKDINGWED